MKALDLQSEKYQPTGSISADGVRNQLGRPRLDRLTLLVREAVQNSWDARARDQDPITFALSIGSVSPEARKLLLEVVLRRAAEGIPMAKVLDRDPLRFLVVYCRGTTGPWGAT